MHRHLAPTSPKKLKNFLVHKLFTKIFSLFPGFKCGVEASTNLIHHNPWLVYLEYWRGENRIDLRCAATLIDSRHVITAAHCIRTPKFSRLVARLGEYDLSSPEDCVADVCDDPVVRIDVDDIVVHPDYDGKDHDIAVLRLAEDAPYTGKGSLISMKVQSRKGFDFNFFLPDFIRPVCLPYGKLQPDSIFEASGWGEIPAKGYYSSTKKVIILPYWEKSACQAAYKNLKVPDHAICAGGVEGVDTCRGDSGGPLVLVRDRIELWGVTSAGNSHCGTKGSPGIYTNVVDHVEWVDLVLSRDF
ncbi:CLIP domain-containing serine protease B15-like [Trichoplusia ni]|uniref:CLIP domain-containing serine protease B15-like n=1 Tax=Trichoplusia ni TaxID=7111 RepID=A0A7E5W5D5_TRINI|nr:CLIP domain-containing serine protease B15-like [Trichoplusia ni]